MFAFDDTDEESHRQSRLEDKKPKKPSQGCQGSSPPNHVHIGKAETPSSPGAPSVSFYNTPYSVPRPRLLSRCDSERHPDFHRQFSNRPPLRKQSLSQTLSSNHASQVPCRPDSDLRAKRPSPRSERAKRPPRPRKSTRPPPASPVFAISIARALYGVLLSAAPPPTKFIGTRLGRPGV